MRENKNNSTSYRHVEWFPAVISYFFINVIQFLQTNVFHLFLTNSKPIELINISFAAEK